jgi:uncharacterized sporulation protein YeaH/YhbH (DUF444 family)
MDLRNEFDNFKTKIEETIKENEELRLQLKEANVKDGDIKELIVSEDIVLNSINDDVYNDITHRLLENFNISPNKNNRKALLIAAMDVSGSMGAWERFIAKCFYTWIERILNAKYDQVEVKYITHHTIAEIVDRDAFYTGGEHGGTIASSAYREANKLIEEYDYDDYDGDEDNLFAVDAFFFHVSDGDNLTSDNKRSSRLIGRLLGKVVHFGYIETNPYGRGSTLGHLMNTEWWGVKSNIVKNKGDLYDIIRNQVFEVLNIYDGGEDSGYEMNLYD